LAKPVVLLHAPGPVRRSIPVKRGHRSRECHSGAEEGLAGGPASPEEKRAYQPVAEMAKPLKWSDPPIASHSESFDYKSTAAHVSGDPISATG
jgi:hypothetical protein